MQIRLKRTVLQSTNITLIRIQHAQETRGVIVFTDPDFPGRRIRAIIEERIPGVKHAFLEKKLTIAKNGQGLGIEHAHDEHIRAAISSVYTVEDQPVVDIPLADLMRLGLSGIQMQKDGVNA